MTKFTIKNLDFIPASHEDQSNPGSLKKVIMTVDDVEITGTIQMINWAKLPPGKNFNRHYHEKMDEIFIFLRGKADIEVDGDKEIVEKTDAVYIPMAAKHSMTNVGKDDVDYIAIGVVKEPGGKTVVVK